MIINGTRLAALCRHALLAGLLAGALVAALAGPARAIEIIDSAGGTIYIEVNKGRLLRLDDIPATVFLANPEIADLQLRTSRLVYLHGKKTGETSLFALDKRDEVLLNRKIVVGYDLDQLNAAIEQLIPNSGITASMVNNTLVLDGVVGSPAQAEAVREIAKTFTNGGPMLNRVKVSMPNQVNLRVVIAEVSRSIAKELGFDYSITSNDFLFNTFLSSESTNTLLAGISKSVGPLNIEATVRALEAERLLTVLAEPNLTAISGETASFLAGGEFPVAGPADDKGRVSIEFKPFGVSLAFTPTLLDDTRISLKVRPEVSQIASVSAVTVDGQTAPSLQTRRAETTVELGNGESLAIAGLLQRNNDQTISKVPALGDLPILGTLFRSKDYQRDETELVIIVTPYIVRPTKDRIARPTDGFEPPNDYESYVWGALYRDTTGHLPERIARDRGYQLIGPVGFQIE